MKYKVGGLFSGVGGIELAFEKSGFDIAWSNEIDSFCVKTCKLNFSHKIYDCDIKNLNGNDLEPVDVLCGGFPCQAFSIAGYQKGFKDDRGNIFFEIIRLINELKRKPKVLFLENVKNLKGHDKGKTLKIIYEIITDNGYSVFCNVLNTSDYTKIPQNRERTFLICFRDEKDWEFSKNFQKTSSYKFSQIFPPQKLNSSNHIGKYLEKKVDDKYVYGEEKYMYKELKKSIKSEDTFYQWRRKYVRENKSNLCPTLTANMGTGGHNVPLLTQNGIYRKLTPRECFNLQGFPKRFKLPQDVPNTQLYKQAGNSVTVSMITLLAKLIKKCI
jgi:DNA (cytosine-5)-methyltransferase 1